MILTKYGRHGKVFSTPFINQWDHELIDTTFLDLATTVVVFCSFFGWFLFSCIPSATARIMCFLPEGFQNV